MTFIRVHGRPVMGKPIRLGQLSPSSPKLRYISLRFTPSLYELFILFTQYFNSKHLRSTVSFDQFINELSQYLRTSKTYRQLRVYIQTKNLPFKFLTFTFFQEILRLFAHIIGIFRFHLKSFSIFPRNFKGTYLQIEKWTWVNDDYYYETCVILRIIFYYWKY